MSDYSKLTYDELIYEYVGFKLMQMSLNDADRPTLSVEHATEYQKLREEMEARPEAKWGILK